MAARAGAPMLCFSAYRMLGIAALSVLAGAALWHPTRALPNRWSESANAAGTAQTQVGEHRHGQRVPMERAPAKVRAAFASNNGEHLANLVGIAHQRAVDGLPLASARTTRLARCSPLLEANAARTLAGTAQSQVGGHRHGQRVEYELAPAKVRAAFASNNGEHLANLVVRADASGQPVYCALVRDTDQSLVVLVVAEDGHIIDKQPPRRHAPWRASDEDQWSGESDTGLWSLADSDGRRRSQDNPLLERRAQREQIGGAAPVGSLSSDH